LAGSVAVIYEEQDEVIKARHRNGVHKYKTYFQAKLTIYSFTALFNKNFLIFSQSMCFRVNLNCKDDLRWK